MRTLSFLPHLCVLVGTFDPRVPQKILYVFVSLIFVYECIFLSGDLFFVIEIGTVYDSLFSFFMFAWAVEKKGIEYNSIINPLISKLEAHTQTLCDKWSFS